MAKNIESIVNHLKSVGFFFSGSGIYGGLANTWDVGPLGVILKNNLKQLWIKEFITKENNYLIESSIFMNPKVWEASGHLKNFSDSQIDCKKCKLRFCAEKLINKNFSTINFDENNMEEMYNIILNNNIKCENCGGSNWTEVRNFQLMFETNFALNNENKNHVVYLRPETAQGIFINFQNIWKSQRARLPFGVGQIGKSFRNEITPGNFIFRTKEFEQMELEFFVKQSEAKEWWNFYLNKIEKFLINILKISPDNLQKYEHPSSKLSHYSNATVDFEYNFPFGWEEMWGIANRGDFDLKAQSEYSGSDLRYMDPLTHEKFFPFVIEPSVGVERLMLAVLCDAYEEEVLEDKTKRIVLKINHNLVPYLVCVNPLSKQLESKAKEVFQGLNTKYSVIYDNTGNIGKRYRRQDAIGTPFCITIDFDTENDNCVTIRNRDTMKQERVKIEAIPLFLDKYQD